MKLHSMLFVGALAFIALPVTAQAQGIVRGAQQGNYDGSRVAGPVGGAVGTVVGGALGGAVGGVKGVLGIPQNSGYHKKYRTRHVTNSGRVYYR